MHGPCARFAAVARSRARRRPRRRARMGPARHGRQTRLGALQHVAHAGLTTSAARPAHARGSEERHFPICGWPNRARPTARSGPFGPAVAFLAAHRVPKPNRSNGALGPARQIPPAIERTAIDRGLRAPDRLTEDQAQRDRAGLLGPRLRTCLARHMQRDVAAPMPSNGGGWSRHRWKRGPRAHESRRRRSDPRHRARLRPHSRPGTGWFPDPPRRRRATARRGQGAGRPRRHPVSARFRRRVRRASRAIRRLRSTSASTISARITMMLNQGMRD